MLTLLVCVLLLQVPAGLVLGRTLRACEVRHG